VRLSSGTASLDEQFFALDEVQAARSAFFCLQKRARLFDALIAARSDNNRHTT